MSILFQSAPFLVSKKWGAVQPSLAASLLTLPNLHDGGVILQKLLRLAGFREADMERVAVDFHDLAAAERLVVDCVADGEGDARGLLLPRLRVDIAA